MPGNNVDSTPHHHLQQLQGGDDHGQHLWHRDPEQGHQEICTMFGLVLLHSLSSIVAVHEGVHAVVHHHEPAAGGGELYIGIPSKP